MGKAIPLHRTKKVIIPNFPIKLQWDKKMIIDVALGSHDQYFVYAYGIVLANFMDPVSCQEYIKFLTESHFKPFTQSEEGAMLIEKLYLAYEKERLLPEFDKEGHLIVREAKDKNKIN